MTRAPRSTLADISQAVRGRARESRSDLYWWIDDHFEQLQGDLPKPGAKRLRPNWTVITERLNILGLRDTKGQPLKSDNVRKIWTRVARDRAGQATTKAARTQDPPRRPEHAPTEPAPEAPSRYRFVPATPKKPRES